MSVCPGCQPVLWEEELPRYSTRWHPSNRLGSRVQSPSPCPFRKKMFLRKSSKSFDRIFLSNRHCLCQQATWKIVCKVHYRLGLQPHTGSELSREQFSSSRSLHPSLCCPKEMNTWTPEFTSLYESIWREVASMFITGVLLLTLRVLPLFLRFPLSDAHLFFSNCSEFTHLGKLTRLSSSGSTYVGGGNP